MSSKAEELNNALDLKIQDLKAQLKLWESKEKETQDKIDAKKIELTQQGIPFDLGKINQISRDIIDYDKKVNKLLEDQKRLKTLQEERAKLIQARRDIKKEITRKHLLFAQKINEITISGISELVFVIGSSCGIANSVSQRADFKLSFSKMTFLHQFARLILVEQIYRAFKIIKGETYHK